MKKIPSEFRNILIIKLRHLGDVLTTTPVIAGIKQAWPEARITYLVNPGAEDLVRYHPDVAEVLTVPRVKGRRAQGELIYELRRRPFDLAIELSEGDRGAFLAWASRTPVRVGYRPAHKRLLDRRLLFTHLIEARSVDFHTVEFHLQALHRLGIDPGRPPLSMHWPAEAQTRVEEVLGQNGIGPGDEYAVVHPPSRWMFKAWRPEGNAEVIDWLAGRGLKVVVTSAPEDEELAFVDQVLTHAKSAPVNLGGRLSLTELAALLAGGRLFFGVDSLPMHMAAAVGTTAVALFGPSGEQHWAPWGEGHRAIAKDWECRPCGRDGCEGSKISRCLVEIEAEEVFPVLEEVLGGP